MRRGVSIGPGRHPLGQVSDAKKTRLGQVRGLTALGPSTGQRRDPSCCLEAFSCSYTQFGGVGGMGGLEANPAFQGNPQGLCGTAHHPRIGGRGGG